MDIQEKQVPLYACTGEHIGSISVEKAMSAAQCFDMSLRFKGRGRKSRITAAYLSERKPTFSVPKATLSMGDMLKNAEGHADAAARRNLGVCNAMAKVRQWPLTFDEKNVGVCAGRIINPTFMEVIPENTASFA